jgi:hypothetical protein
VPDGLNPSRLHASSRRSAAAAKVRAYRQRQRLDLAVLRVTVPQYEIAELLIASGRLSVAEALDRRRVECAVAEAVVELAARWLPRRG